jgi:hypothetical protein
MGVSSKKPLLPQDIKAKLIEICRQENKPYGYRVETLAGFSPRLLYRVYEKDGREELVRGAEFNELDTRALRNDLIAVGNDALVSRVPHASFLRSVGILNFSSDTVPRVGSSHLRA